MSPKRIALFGGTFDPIHIGHLEVAKHAARQLRADQLVLIPAKRSPLKEQIPQASDQDRLNMIQLAIGNDPAITLSTCDLDRPAPSYTRDTVRIFRQQSGHQGPLFWLIGADAVQELSRWYRVEELLQDCTVASMLRAGCSPPDFDELGAALPTITLDTLRNHVLSTPAYAISSSHIREQIALGEKVDQWLQPEVWDYIQRNGLYGLSD
jgi:nicotinate-nucleotide adenylyltransferase